MSMRVAHLLNISRAVLEDVERNLELVQEGQLLYYKQILMYALHALGAAVDALISARLGARPSGHDERLLYLSQLNRDDLKKLYEWLIVLVFSKLETVQALSKSELRTIISEVREAVNRIEREIREQSQHV